MSFLFGLHGRIDRRQWWLGHLLNVVLLMAFTFAFAALGNSGLQTLVSSKGGLGLAPVVGASLTCFWISLASTVKRYHDRNKSGWWAAITLVPGIGLIWSFIECGLMPGTPGTNTYGPPPRDGKWEPLSELRRHETDLANEMDTLRAQDRDAQREAALANARYASDVRKILAAG